ncbi:MULTISPECIES: flagellar protein FlgN [unclassified Pseudodesulfovibrio]|uniref:flagellar protein FlgN n=1 Tax=unclassified Pseudodesulfovibrio TaxID=2661612 RepID=UPI000FEBFEC0|nr:MULTISPECIES: flagellar protein FlgN [unclassified Pseudodesulfovibrio]MCJ2163184.1 flagellar protein FlgN [Pseudodesulfovibrio sp. S3-i]RWU07172.1 flagellar protein FlgN [Pseudodesulfovibrio sp. S3]
MIRLIEENLVRQNKAMMLMSYLLEEEFSRLTNLKPQSVSQIELSIQELMRQIAAERISLRNLVAKVDPVAKRVKELLPGLGDAEGESLQALLKMLDDTEQKCGVQAAKNQQMAMALFDQSKGLLNFMHDQIKPKSTTAYGRSGRFAKGANSARLLSGRL